MNDQNLTAFEHYLAGLDLLDLHREAEKVGYRIRAATFGSFDLEYQGGYRRFRQRGIKTFQSKKDACEYLSCVRNLLDKAETSPRGQEMLFHTDSCWNTLERQQQHATEWMERFPQYCMVCNGRGQLYDHGDFYQPPSTDLCWSCTDLGVCARCGEPGLTCEEVGRGEGTGSGPCTFCGWNYDDSLPIVECIC